MKPPAALYSSSPPPNAGTSPSPVVCYEYTYSHHSNSNHSDTNSNSLRKGFAAPVAVHAAPVFSAADLQQQRPLSEHFYEQPMRVLTAPAAQPSPTATACSHRSNCSGGSSSGGNLPLSLGLPRWADPSQVAWTRVGEAGTRVTIPRSAVSLTVPQGAIEPGRTEEVWISVLSPASTDGLRPPLTAGQVLIAPVVVVGPPHLSAHLRKPVVVSIPHSGGSTLRQVTVLQCDRLDNGGGSTPGAAPWRIVAVSDEEDTTSSTSVYKDATMCQLVTERLAAFALATNAADLMTSARSAATSSTTTTVSSTASSSGCSSIGSSPTTLTPMSSSSSPPPFRIPSAVKSALCRLLDPPSSNGDWRLLAERLGVDRYVGFFASQPSPTEAILNLWEARHRESTAVAGLVNILRSMGRLDAAQILDQDASWP